jgi:hypothetical protein
MAVSKEEILLAIKREAAGNGGQPLGVERFIRATGIKQSEWAGRYWARWSDALIEAGFAPNTWQGHTQSDDEILRRLADLALGLGHYPTTLERKLHHIADSAFPDAKTVDNRLGNRDEQLSKLLDLSLTDERYSPIHDMVRPLMMTAADDATPAQVALGVKGSVYLMQSGRHYKIGFSGHVGRRAYEVALQLPERLEVVHEIETDDPEGIERYWHDRFAAKRTNGEWFLLAPDDVAAFKRRKTYM